MNITRITEENSKYFYGLLGHYWDERTSDDIFIGATDDDREAVAACVMKLNGLDMVIKFFAVAPSRANEGIGYEFLQMLIDHIFSFGCQTIKSIFFCAEGQRYEWQDFLEGFGFSIEPLGVQRCYFSIDDAVYSKEDKLSLPQNYSIIRANRMSLEMGIKLQKLAEDMEENGIYASVESVLDSSNRYGGVLVKDNEIIAAVSAIPFFADVMIDTVIINTKSSKEVGLIIDYIIEQAGKERNRPKHVVFDYADNAMDNIVRKLITDRGLVPEETEQGMQAYITAE